MKDSKLLEGFGEGLQLGFNLNRELASRRLWRRLHIAPLKQLALARRYQLPKELAEFKVLCPSQRKPLFLAALVSELAPAGPTIIFAASVEMAHRSVALCRTGARSGHAAAATCSASGTGSASTFRPLRVSRGCTNGLPTPEALYAAG